MNVVISIVLLGAGLIGFYVMQWPNSLLFLLFLIIAYPPALATTVQTEWRARDIIEMYRIGVSQIPFLGGIISAVMGSNSKPPRPPRNNR
jgi:hypothetical protein